MHHIFIDFKQAYDSVLRVELWQAMAELSIPQKLIKLTQMCVNGSKSRVRIGSTVSSAFDINNGLKQGDALSPLLFNIALEKAIRAANIKVEMYTNDGPKLLLAFADDIDVMARSVLKVKEQFIKIEKETLKMGLAINETKTKYMYVSRQAQRDRIGQNVTIGDFNFERVNSFKYLGAVITADNDITEEVKARIQSGNRCMYALDKTLRSKRISRRAKIRIYKSIIRPVVMYGCETWTLTKDSERKLRVFERKVLRRVFGPILDPVHLVHRTRKNRELTELYKEPDIVNEIKGMRLRWAGHVQRLPNERTAKLAWENYPAGKRPLGRPRMRWRDNVISDLRTMGLDYDPQMLMDRQGWRRIVQSARTHIGL